MSYFFLKNIKKKILVFFILFWFSISLYYLTPRVMKHRKIDERPLISLAQLAENMRPSERRASNVESLNETIRFFKDHGIFDHQGVGGDVTIMSLKRDRLVLSLDGLSDQECEFFLHKSFLDGGPLDWEKGGVMKSSAGGVAHEIGRYDYNHLNNELVAVGNSKAFVDACVISGRIEVTLFLD